MTRRLLFIFPLALVLAACGGLGTPGTAFTVSPQTATTTIGGKVNIIVVVANADVQSYHYSVEGGDSNGTVVANFNDNARAQYTAPQTQGVYTVHASFVQFGGETHSSDVTITVE